MVKQLSSFKRQKLSVYHFHLKDYRGFGIDEPCTLLAPEASHHTDCTARVHQDACV